MKLAHDAGVQSDCRIAVLPGGARVFSPFVPPGKID
jgi:hypothetical protein